MMVEAEATADAYTLIGEGATAPTEEIVAQGLEAAKPFLRQLCQAQQELAAQSSKETGEFKLFPPYQSDVFDAVYEIVGSSVAEAQAIAGKHDREARVDEIKGDLLVQLGDRFAGREAEIGKAYQAINKKVVRQRIITDQVRIDGRGLTDIRTLSAEVGYLPRVHGSALFERGETQILGVTTLNMLRMEQQLDTLSPETRKRYMHNYNFPPYSTGETGRVGSPKRREIGHGALAERALVPVLPSKQEFPYAIRQVSEALGSNGSTSMGSVCASTLSLLNAGVPLKAPVAGIAMGLVSAEIDGETQYVALTDILGAEDAFGDMDFKVAGTRQFVTALQLDTKLDGIPSDVLQGRAVPGQGRPADDPRRHERGDRRARRDERQRAAHHLGQDPGRQDRRAHRAEGQDDQLDHRADRRRHRHRGRRHRLRLRRIRRSSAGRDRRSSTRSRTRSCPRSGSASSAPSSRPPPSVRSSRCCRVGTASCTSPSSAAASGSPRSRTWSTSATSCRSRSPRSTPAARSAWCRWQRKALRRRWSRPTDRRVTTATVPTTPPSDDSSHPDPGPRARAPMVALSASPRSPADFG